MNTAKDLFTKVLSRAADSTKSKPGLFGLLSDNSITLKNLLFSAVVVGLELLLSSKFFDCPLNNHVLYGVLFLVSPFFIVLIMNMLLVGNPWDITDRCFIKRYRRRRRRRRRRRQPDDENRRCCRVECLSGECCYWVCPNLTKACVGPCVWLIASFADTKYVVCAAVGQDIEKRNLTNVTEIKQLEAEFADAKALSHILAWIAFLILVAGTGIVMTSKKCCLKDNVLLEDEYILDRREAVAALVTFRHYIQRPSEHGGGKPSPDPNKSGGAVGEDKKAEDEKKEKKKNDGIIATDPVSIAGGTDTLVSVSGSGPIASIEDAIVPTTSSNVEAPSPVPNVSALGTTGENKNKKDRITDWFKKILGVGQDKEKEEENDEVQAIPGRFMGKEEEITLYPEGMPEQRGKKWVEDLFEDWSKKKRWYYIDAYLDFQKRYPRVISGRPWDEWVLRENSDDDHSDGTPKKPGHQYSRVRGIEEATSSV